MTCYFMLVSTVISYTHTRKTVGKEVENLEPSGIAHKHVKWCSCGKQNTGSSRN